MTDVLAAPAQRFQGAGPSRLSPPPAVTLPSASMPSREVPMEESMDGEADRIRVSDEAALLLAMSSCAEERSPSALDVHPGPSLLGPPPLLPPPQRDPIYPYTPPDEPMLQSSSLSEPPLLKSLLPTHAGPSKPKVKRPRKPTAETRRIASIPPPPPFDSANPPAHYLGEDNGIIRCICDVAEDDGFTIQCEGCFAWEHGQCFGYEDAASAPDVFFCELCSPRPVDRAAARARQQFSRMRSNHSRATSESKGPKGKTKRQRSTSLMEMDNGVYGSDSSRAMGPPSMKPKRKSTQGKTRAAKQSTIEPVATPTLRAVSLPAEEPSRYFDTKPWEMEYTPIEHNLVRTKAARASMMELLREWVEMDDLAMSKRQIIDHATGLPSPTETGAGRLTPEIPYLQPDFSVLAPPLPPVQLVAESLEPLEIQSYVDIVSDGSSFLPINYSEPNSGMGVYLYPTRYGVFATGQKEVGDFLGEYSGEILDAETYHRDPINQYQSLGVPKPHVHRIGPPINLLIDARGYGNHLRFIRSGCHPNALIRPIIWKVPNSPDAQVRFGIFACRPIRPDEELVLPWEWDDQHVVHSFRHIVEPAMFPDGTVAHPVLHSTTEIAGNLADKFDVVLTHLFGIFSSCACSIPGHCAMSQMRNLVELKDSLTKLSPPHGRRGGVVALGDLVGAVRGWRRRELEMEDVRRWANPGAFIKLSDMPRIPLTASKSPRFAPEAEDVMDSNLACPFPDAILPQIPTETDEEVEVLEDRRDQEMPEVMDDGEESDATTATIPRSHFTDSEPEGILPVFPGPAAKKTFASTRQTRVVLEMQEDSDADSLPPAAIRIPRRGPGRPKNKILARPLRAEAGSSPGLLSRRGRKPKNRIAASESESDGHMDVDPPGMLPNHDGLAIAPGQSTAPMASPTELVPPRSPTPQEPTPPRDPTPSPKSPSPPPEPPKKFSLAEYLEEKKLRQDQDALAGDKATDVKPDTDTPLQLDTSFADPSARLNLFDYLPVTQTPSAMSASVTPATQNLLTPHPGDSPRSALPTPAYRPRERTDSYFPTVGVALPASASGAFQPRSNSAYTPRPEIATPLLPTTPTLASNPNPMSGQQPSPTGAANDRRWDQESPRAPWEDRAPPFSTPTNPTNIPTGPAGSGSSGPKIPPSGPRGFPSTSRGFLPPIRGGMPPFAPRGGPPFRGRGLWSPNSRGRGRGA